MKRESLPAKRLDHDDRRSSAERYALKHPRRVISGDCENYPALRDLYCHAKLVRDTRHKAKGFTRQGVPYSIVWQGKLMCVMHVPTGTLLVGAPGVEHE